MLLLLILLILIPLVLLLYSIDTLVKSYTREQTNVVELYSRDREASVGSFVGL